MKNVLVLGMGLLYFREVEMVLVQQLDREGCTIACLAMLLNCDYYEMRKKLDDLNHSFSHLLSRWGEPEFILTFYPKEICGVLLQLRIISEYVKWYENEDKNDNNSTHILLLSPAKHPEYTHAVIYHDRMIYDPTKDKPQPNNLENFNVHCCIRVNDAIPA